jgi:hypothetical protein
MEQHVEIVWDVMSATAHLDGKVNVARKILVIVILPLVLMMPDVLICSKIISVSVQKELMARIVKHHLKDALDLPV